MCKQDDLAVVRSSIYFFFSNNDLPTSPVECPILPTAKAKLATIIGPVANESQLTHRIPVHHR